MGTETNFEECPMFNKAHKNSRDLDNLHKANRDILKHMKKRDKADAKKSAYLMQHMEDEEIHHKATNEAITRLLDDKRLRDEARDKKEAIRDKVLASIAVACMIGAYNFFMDVMAIKQSVTTTKQIMVGVE